MENTFYRLSHIQVHKEPRKEWFEQHIIYGETNEFLIAIRDQNIRQKLL
jgi:hypothetical protein